MSVRIKGGSPAGPRLLTKKDVTDLEGAGVKLRRQMDVHVMCLDAKSSAKLEMVQEWHEYLKKRSEIEMEYAKKLDKLSDHTLERITRLKKSSGKEYVSASPSSAVDLFHTVVSDNKGLANRRMSFCDDINFEVIPRLDVVTKDVNVAARRVKEGLVLVHEEIKKAHSDLVEAVKAYMAACLASEESQSKLSKIQASRSKGKNVDKDAKKEIKMLEGLMSNKFKAITCRNEYITALETFNKLCRLYFGTWSSDVLEFFDFQFHHAISAMQRMEGELEKSVAQLQMKNIDCWLKQLEYLSPKADLQKFRAANMSAFPSHTDVVFLPYGPSERNGLMAVTGVYQTMESQRSQVTVDIGKTSIKLDETHKSLLEAQTSFTKCQETVYGNHAIAECIEEEAKATSTKNKTHMTSAMSSVLASRREHHDGICSSFNKLAEHTVELSKRYTLADLLDGYLNGITDADVKKNTQALATESLKNEESQTQISHLDMYMVENSQKIPPIVTSCIRFVEEHGPTVEGVFRVPGIVSQIEEMMESFDEDKDPLYCKSAKGTESTKTYDIHAVASLLKQYLRDLPEPVFPFSLFQRIVDVQSKSDQKEKVSELVNIMKDLPENRLIVLREIMRFLDKFSEHSTATKMNTNNLALVFGPTLLASPPEMDAVMLAQHTTNVNLVTHLMVENRVEIFGEPVNPEPEPEVEAEEVVEIEARTKHVLFCQLEESLLHALQQESEVLTGVEGEYATSTNPAAPVGDCARPGVPLPAPPAARIVNADTNVIRRSSVREDRGSVDTSNSNPSAEAADENSPLYACPTKPNKPAQAKRESVVSTGSDLPAEQNDQSTPTVVTTAPSSHALCRQASGGIGFGAAISPADLARKRSSVPASIATTPDDKEPPGSPKRSLSRATSAEPSDSGISGQDTSTGGSTRPSSESSSCSTSDQKSATSEARASDCPSATPLHQPTLHQVKASHSYTARTAKELSFTKGLVIDVFAKSPDGNWWDSVIEGKRGYIPASYVKVVTQ